MVTVQKLIKIYHPIKHTHGHLTNIYVLTSYTCNYNYLYIYVYKSREAGTLVTINYGIGLFNLFYNVINILFFYTYSNVHRVTILFGDFNNFHGQRCQVVFCIVCTVYERQSISTRP